jgi:hypothetical protein
MVAGLGGKTYYCAPPTRVDPTPTAMAATSPNYGLDAPAVVRNLLLAGGAGLILAALIGLGLIPRAIE